MKHHIPQVSLLLACLPVGLTAQIQVAPPYNTRYTATSLGTVPGVPTPYGGLTIQAQDPNFLLLGGTANSSTGALYRIRVVRDGQNHITGFSGTATRYADAAYNDGGVAYGPNNVLFLARWPVNEVGQTKFGSVITDRIIPLAPAVGASPGALTFVPPGFANAGHLKICGYSGGGFYDATVSPDGNGTFNINNITFAVSVGGGPEGITYIPPASPLFADYQSMLLCDYSAGRIAAFDVDGTASPVVATRRDFITGLSGAEGATIDPATGDFMFSTFGGGNQVVIVTGFGQPCASFVNYGTGLAGTGGRIPTIGGSGCAARNLAIAINIGNGLSGGGGILALGSQQANIPLLGGTLLLVPQLYITHTLSSSGSISLPTQIPDDGNLVGVNFYTQSFYVDLAAPQLLSMTNGLTSQIR
jgi:hypothetical protein